MKIKYLFLSVLFFPFLHADYLEFDNKNLATLETVAILSSVNVVPQRCIPKLDEKHLFNVALTLKNFGCIQSPDFYAKQNGISEFSMKLTYEQAEASIENIYLYRRTQLINEFLQCAKNGKLEKVTHLKYFINLPSWKEDKSFCDFCFFVVRLESEKAAVIVCAAYIWNKVAREVMNKAKKLAEQMSEQIVLN